MFGIDNPKSHGGSSLLCSLNSTYWLLDKRRGLNSQKVTIATVRKITNEPELASLGNGGDSFSEGKEHDYLIKLKQINNVQNRKIITLKQCS